MITVYFESKTHSEQVAVMSESLYNDLYPILEKLAQSDNMILTESNEEALK